MSARKGLAGAPVSLPERERARLPYDDRLGHGGRGAVRQRRGARLAGGGKRAHAGRGGQAGCNNDRPCLCDGVGHGKAPVALVRHGACAPGRLSAPVGAQLRTEPESGVTRGVQAWKEPWEQQDRHSQSAHANCNRRSAFGHRKSWYLGMTAVAHSSCMKFAFAMKGGAHLARALRPPRPR